MNLLDVLNKQASIYKEILKGLLDKAKTEHDVYQAHSTVLKEFYNHAYKPMTDGDTIKDINSEKMNDLMLKMSSDIEIAHGQLNGISNMIGESFNSNQDYKTSLKNKVEYLSSIVSDVNIMMNEDGSNSVVFKDSLSNYDFVDKNFGSGTQANIATSEGIAFLAVEEQRNLTETAKAVKVSGNGQAGNYNIVKKVDIQTFSEDYNIYVKYKSEDDSHDNPNSIIDSEAATWFEYQKLGVDQSYIRYYGLGWGSADRIKDELNLRINIELEKAEIINWIDIAPYIPEQCKSNISLYSVKASTDGSNYVSVYKDKEIIDKEINLVPQRYTEENMFKGDSLSKFVSQGVLNFAPVQAKFIEIILKQTKPYDELLGTVYYQKITTVDGREVSRVPVKEQYVSPDIVGGPQGKHRIDGSNYITKEMAIFKSWRYLIGIRGIDVYNKKFAEQSEIITKKFDAPKSIKKIVLYANEIIPDEFIEYGLDKRNDWIKYYISINDSDWYPISPMHHNQVGGLKIPPKIYEINSASSHEERIASINKGYISSDKEVTSVRLKAVFSRPSTMNTFTPILEEYALKCVLEGGIEQ